MASSRRSCATSLASARRSPRRVRTRSGTSSGLVLRSPATAASSAALAQMREGRRPGQRLDPAHPGARRALTGDGEGADIPGAPHMRAAAELDRIGLAIGALARPIERAHRHDPDLVAVFLAKERLRTERAGIVGRHDPRLDGAVLANERVDLRLDLCHLRLAQRRSMGKVEAQPSGALRLPRCAT